MTRADTGGPNGGVNLNCSQIWAFEQTGRTFTGGFSSQGQGSDSDWRCAHSRRFIGELADDGSVWLEFDRVWRPGGCTNEVGPTRITGQMTGNNRVTLSFAGGANCQMYNRPDSERFDLNYTITFHLSPHQSTPR